MSQSTRSAGTLCLLLLLVGLAAPAMAQDVLLEKATNGLDADSAPGPVVLVGSTVSWTYQVTAGSRDLANVGVTDDQGVTVTCPQSTLSGGESMVCTASAPATSGQYANLGTVDATIVPGGQPVTASDPSHYFGLTELALSLEKATNGFDADTAPGPILPVGSPVDWTYEVTNTATDPLDNVSVTDDQGVVVICPQTTLAPGESMTCTGSGTAQLGQYSNLGTASAELPGSIQVLASDPSHYRGQALVLQKTTNGADADVPPGPSIPFGDPITWIYQVSNPGPATVSDLVVIDDQGVAVSCPFATLAAGESMDCTGSGVAVLGPYANLGTVSGALPEGTPLEASDPSHYSGFLPGAIVLEKATNGVDADTPPGPVLAVGVPVDWTYEVTNPGLDPISNIVVTDSEGVAVTCPDDSLDGGESMVCTASGVSVAGPYQNLGTADGELPGPIAVTASDFSHYYGQDQILDWGDAPAPYPTGVGDGGASHEVGGPVHLGSCVDSELDGQPSTGAGGDDLGPGGTTVGTCAVAGDDEDGVTFLDPLVSGGTVDLEVEASAPCTLTAFIDFDVDGDWNDPADALFPAGAVLVAGVNVLSFTVPVDAVGGTTFARFRCTTDTPPEGSVFGPAGAAADGEVEDYAVEIELDIEATLVDSPGTPAMPGDTISYRADITSVAGTARGLALDVPLDPNMALTGGVTTTPLAIDDGPYQGDPVLPTTVNGVEQPRLIENDFGIPSPAAVAVAGQVTDLGGSVDVDADGSFTYTPPPGAVGGEVDSFTYELENAIPPRSPVVDTATATIVLSGGAPGVSVGASSPADLETVDAAVEGVPAAVHVAIGELPFGATIAVFFDATVDLPFPAGVTQVSNQGTVSAPNFEGVLTDDPDEPSGGADPTVTPVLAMPSLAGATKTVADPAPGNGDGMAQPGEAITYAVTVINSGNGGDLDVRVVDTLPAGTTLDLGSIQVVLGGGATGVTDASGGDTVDLTIASVPGAGGQAVVTFRATIDSPVAAGHEVLSNTAQVSSTFVPQFDTTQADIPIDAVPDFTLDKEDGGVTVDPGATVVYTLSWTNVGEQDASNVVLEDTVPVGSSFAAGASDPAWSCGDGDPEGTLCTLALGTLAGLGGSGSAAYAVEVAGPRDAPPSIDNSAAMRDDGAGSGGAPVAASAADSTPVNDLLPPRVAAIETIKGSGDGSLDECESVANRVSALRVTFSEAMDETTVVDAANWQVVGAGPDLDLSTEDCAGTVGDDVSVGIDGVSYDGLTLRALVELATTPWLDDGPYRVMACSGPGGLADPAGNELDGDGDSSGGDDFVRYFRIDRIDRFANGHFDCGLDDWTTVSPGRSTVEHEPLMDLDDAAISGSARFTSAAGNTQLGIGQCVEVDGEAVHDLDGFVYLDTAGLTLAVIRTCDFFAAADCSGPGMPAQAFFTNVSTDSTWIGFAGEVVIPAAAGSTLCQVTLRNAAGLPYEAFLDDLSFDLLQSPVVFEDGFEGGDTSEWSQTVP